MDRKKRSFPTSETYPNIRRLVDEFGPVKAAQKIGMSSSALKDILTGRQECRLPYEQSAAWIVQNQLEKGEKDGVALIARVPRSELEMIKIFLRGMRERGVRFVIWDDL